MIMNQWRLKANINYVLLLCGQYWIMTMKTNDNIEWIMTNDYSIEWLVVLLLLLILLKRYWNDPDPMMKICEDIISNVNIIEYWRNYCES